MQTQNNPVRYVLFANGKVWPIKADGSFDGSVEIDSVIDCHGIDNVQAAIAAALLGDDNAWAAEIDSVTPSGDRIVIFKCILAEFEWAQSSIEQFQLDIDQFGAKVIDPESDEMKAALVAQFGMSPMEVEHALDNLSTVYGDECVLPILGSHCAIHTPAYPAECDYVRVVVGGYEIAYWTAQEWRDDPACVMGAIIGAAKGMSE